MSIVVFLLGTHTRASAQLHVPNPEKAGIVSVKVEASQSKYTSADQVQFRVSLVNSSTQTIEVIAGLPAVETVDLVASCNGAYLKSAGIANSPARIGFFQPYFHVLRPGELFSLTWFQGGKSREWFSLSDWGYFNIPTPAQCQITAVPNSQFRFVSVTTTTSAAGRSTQSVELLDRTT